MPWVFSKDKNLLSFLDLHGYSYSKASGIVINTLGLGKEIGLRISTKGESLEYPYKINVFSHFNKNMVGTQIRVHYSGIKNILDGKDILL